jgi:NTE family protein
VDEAIYRLKRFWDTFAATSLAERMLNFFAYSALRAQEEEVLGLSPPVFSLNPRGAISRTIMAALPLLRGVRREYYDLDQLLKDACPEFTQINWQDLKTRLLVGASDVKNGIETVFDSDCNMPNEGDKHDPPKPADRLRWRERLELSLDGVAASGTLPQLLQAKEINGRYYWDGLYSQNPPIREFVADMRKEYVPDEIWVVRINPQQCARLPQSNAESEDRENELMGNLSLNKELDFIAKVNELRLLPRASALFDKYKEVKVRTIKMTPDTATELRYSSKFDRSHGLIEKLREEGHQVAERWLDQWPDHVGSWPTDAGYWPR